MPVNGWCKIVFTLSVNKAYMEGKKKVKKGDPLFDEDGELIGEALSDLPDSLISVFPTVDRKTRIEVYYMDVYGYTSQSNIRPESLVEVPLKRLLEENSGQLVIAKMEKLIKDFNFDTSNFIRSVFPASKELTVCESDVDNPSPMDRVRLVFLGQNLVAIVHSRIIGYSGIRSVVLSTGHELTFLFALDWAEQQRMRQLVSRIGF